MQKKTDLARDCDEGKFFIGVPSHDNGAAKLFQYHSGSLWYGSGFMYTGQWNKDEFREFIPHTSPDEVAVLHKKIADLEGEKSLLLDILHDHDIAVSEAKPLTQEEIAERAAAREQRRNANPHSLEFLLEVPPRALVEQAVKLAKQSTDALNFIVNGSEREGFSIPWEVRKDSMRGDNG